MPQDFIEGGRLPRRHFLRALAAGAGTAACFLPGCAIRPGHPIASAAFNISSLPVGAAPLPLSLPHFPSRVHAFVWRNWELVPVERIAAVLGTSRSGAASLARVMGLFPQRRITEAQQRRSYITIIKRNWHLLPYEQLLELLGWPAERLEFTLREDDFLWIKLGGLKPKCEQLRWEESHGHKEAEEQMAAMFRASFSPQGAGAGEGSDEPLFTFVTQLSSRPSRANATVPKRDSGLRFCYSYFALYGDPLLEPDLDPYPDHYLERLASAGVNGVWMQGVLHKLAPFPWEPERSNRFEERLRNLRRLATRALHHGIRIFLYLNEPRAMPHSFFTDRPALKGVTEGGHASLCTSKPEVRDWMTDSIAEICRAVPELGGFFTITASENLSNCWSHGGGKACPRCSARAASEVIAEVNTLIDRGVRQAAGTQQVIAWDWGWNDAWAPDAIARLPQSVTFMSVSEWSLPLERGGVKERVGEYCLSAIGPGPRATKHWKLAQARGLKTIAKIQAGNTWELSAVPWIPVAANVAEHARRLRELNLDGVMLGWTLGGYPSPNLAAVAEIMDGGSLSNLAERRFGPALAPHFLKAWDAFGAAFAEFPFDGGVVYGAPLQTGPSNLLWDEPTHYAHTMVGFPYDDLAGWRAQYPEEIFIQQLEKVATGFEHAIAALQPMVEKSHAEEPGQRQAAHDELTVARVAAIHWRSVANQSRFVRARNSLEKSSGAARADKLKEIERLLHEEIRLARELYAIQRADSRIGFEASNQYYYVPLDLAEKVLNCQDLLTRWLPAQRGGKESLSH